MSGIVRYPVSVVDHNKSVQNPVQNDVDALKEYVDKQQTAIPDNVIKGVKEIENFLAGNPDTQTLSSLLNTLTTSLTTAIAAKYSKPSSGIPYSDMTVEVKRLLDKAGTSLQSHQSLQGYATEQWVENKKYLTEHQSLSDYYTKDDSSDLAAIMSLSTLSAAGTTTVTTNPEWQIVMTDNEDKILLGKRQDGTWYTPIPLSDVLDVIISGLSAS